MMRKAFLAALILVMPVFAFGAGDSETYVEGWLSGCGPRAHCGRPVHIGSTQPLTNRWLRSPGREAFNRFWRKAGRC